MTFGSERLLKNLLSKYQHLQNYRHLHVVHVGNFQRKRKQQSAFRVYRVQLSPSGTQFRRISLRSLWIFSKRTLSTT